MSSSNAAKADSEWDGAGAGAGDDRELGYNSVGLPMTMQALLEVLETSAPTHPLRLQVSQALEADSVGLMRAALATWYKLPRFERDRILR